MAVVALAYAQEADSVVDSLGFDSAVSATPADMLRGKVSGVRVGAAGPNPLSPVAVDIRGLNTVHGHNQALFVIDGVIMGAPADRSVSPFWNYTGFSNADPIETLFHINAYDIESIEVLKDASATAIYGSNGANGVVLVKTRRNSLKDRQIDVNSNVAVVGFKSPGLMHNHRVGIGGATSTSSYNVSLSYGSYDDRLSAKSRDNAIFNMGYEHKSSKGVQVGVSADVALGNFSNGDAALDDYDDDGRRYAATASAWLNVNLTKWLKWRNSGGFDFRTYNRYFWYGNGNAVGRAYNGLASIVSYAAMSGNVESVLEFNRYFAGIHHLSADLGLQYLVVKGHYNTSSGNDFFSHELRARGLTASNCEKMLHEYDFLSNRMAFFGRLSYDCNAAGGVDLVLRADSNLKYDKGSYVLYPAASVWLDMMKLFKKNSGIVSVCRLEGGFGVSGREDAMPYSFVGDYLTGNFLPVSVDGQPYYDGLSRLRSSEWNVGGRIAFRPGRLTFSLKYYNRTTDDKYSIFCNGELNEKQNWRRAPIREVSSTVSTVANRGFELSLSAEPVKSGDWNWSVNLNAAYNANQVVSLNYGDLSGTSRYSANVLGYGVNSLLGYKLTPEGYYVDITEDGRITDADRLVLASTLPSFYGGAGTALRYKWLTLDILTDYQMGGHRVDYAKMLEEEQSLLTERYIAKDNYFRIARISLKYDVPLKAKWIQGLSVSLSGCNLACWTTLPGGYEFGDLPLRQSLLLGLSLKF